jgi:hypothetical protein
MKSSKSNKEPSGDIATKEELTADDYQHLMEVITGRPYEQAVEKAPEIDGPELFIQELLATAYKAGVNHVDSIISGMLLGVMRGATDHIKQFILCTINKISPLPEKVTEELRLLFTAIKKHDAAKYQYFMGELRRVIQDFLNNHLVWYIQNPIEAMGTVFDDLYFAPNVDKPDEQGSSMPSVDEDRYATVAAQIEEETRTFRKGVAARLLPALKSKIEDGTYSSYDAKLGLVRWLNSELKRFNFSLRSPDTGLAAVLSADSTTREGRFKLKGEDEDGTMQTLNIPTVADLLAKLALMETPVRREPLREWREKAQQQGSPAKRG